MFPASHFYMLLEVCCASNLQLVMSDIVYPFVGKEVTLRKRSPGERSHQHISLTRIISGWRDIAIYRVSLWFYSRAISCGHTHAHAYAREREGEFLRLSPWEETLAHGKTLIYLVEGAADPRVRWIRDPPVVYSSAYTDGARMDDWEPIPSRRVRTILIADVGDVRSHEEERGEHLANDLDSRKSLPSIPREENSLWTTRDSVSPIRFYYTWVPSLPA